MAQDKLLLGDVFEVRAKEARAGVKVDQKLAGERNRRRDPWRKRCGDALDVAPQKSPGFAAAESNRRVHALDRFDQVTAQGFAVA